MAPGGELVLELLEILDDAVMDDGDAAGRDRMRVGLVGRAMRRPARVADADLAADRLRSEALDQLVELALGAPSLDAALDQRRDASRIIAAVFETAQPVHQQRCHFPFADHANNAAHSTLTLPLLLLRLLGAAPRADFGGALRLHRLLGARDGECIRR